MGLGFCIVLSALLLCRLDRIVLAGSYQETLAFMLLLVTGCMGRMGRWWGGGTDVSRRRNGSATIGAGTGAPPLEKYSFNANIIAMKI